MEFEGIRALEETIESLEDEILEKKKKLAELRRSLPRQEVQDYVLMGSDGTRARLSEMFGPHNEMVLIHNMGKGCVYCTLWADGFNGVVHHLENRAAFVVVSPDEPDVQRRFAESRGWGFKMYSGHGNSFIKDMGFATADNKYKPGVSTFMKDEKGGIYRVASAIFGPGDD